MGAGVPNSQYLINLIKTANQTNKSAMQVISPGTPVRVRSSAEKGASVSSTIQTKLFTPVVGKVDYKNRAYELIRQVAELKTKGKAYETEIMMLKSKIERNNKEIGSFLKKSQCKSFQEILEIIRQFHKIKIVHQFYVKNQQNLKQAISDNKHKPSFESELTEHYSKTVASMLRQLTTQSKTVTSTIQTQNKRLLSQLKQLKLEYQHLLCQNSELKDNITKVREDLRLSIESYETIESEVEQKLKDYLLKIKEYEDVIKRNRDVIKMEPSLYTGGAVKGEEEEKPVKTLRKNRSDFSFGRVSEAGSDGREQPRVCEDMSLNIECYRASVEGLLEQNKRLKKSFMTLYRVKEGEKLPEDLVREIDIMRSIMELNDQTENG